jgi:hypothetical protein
MDIRGIDGMTPEQLRFEVQRGARFVIFQYCISAVIVTFRWPSDVYFIRPEEKAVVKGLPFTFLTLLFGWWGIPWGPIYSVQSLVTNLRGGKDVTAETMAETSIGPSQLYANRNRSQST